MWGLKRDYNYHIGFSYILICNQKKKKWKKLYSYSCMYVKYSDAQIYKLIVCIYIYIFPLLDHMVMNIE